MLINYKMRSKLIMSNKLINFLKNFSYVIVANLLSIIISTIIVLIVPKVIGLEQYGYWQLYLFYSVYVGFLHFGWNDGIYLRYGGHKYNELNKSLFFSQFWMLFLIQIIIGFIIIVVSLNQISNIDKKFILIMTILNMIIINVKLMLVFILQTTNRIKSFAQVTVLEKILYCFFILFLLLAGYENYKILISADLLGKTIALIFAAYCCREIVINKLSLFYFAFDEVLLNVNVGIKLMLGNIASLLIIGVVRLGIERSWDIIVFAKVSLTLSISNLVMIFINAIGIILFPIIKRTEKNKLPEIYLTLRTLLMTTLFLILAIFYPLKIFLLNWLPEYKDSFTYMTLLFPMFVFEAKMALLINTYLKALRLEKLILKINLFTLFMSCIFTVLFSTVYKSIPLLLISIVFLLALRCILAEAVLSKRLSLTVYKDIIFELLMTINFILLGISLEWKFGLLLYFLTYLFYIFYYRKPIRSSIYHIKKLAN